MGVTLPVLSPIHHSPSAVSRCGKDCLPRGGHLLENGVLRLHRNRAGQVSSGRLQCRLQSLIAFSHRRRDLRTDCGTFAGFHGGLSAVG
jgi:hypothetical protein